MFATTDIARRRWPHMAGVRELPQEVSCDLARLFSLSCWLLFVAPSVVVLGSLWRVHMPTRRPRPRRALGDLPPPSRRRVQAPVPPLRRSSSPGRPAGIVWPADSECDSSACGLVWGEDVYAPFLTGRPVMRHPGGPPLEPAASGSTTAGAPKASETYEVSSIRRPLRSCCSVAPPTTLCGWPSSAAGRRRHLHPTRVRRPTVGQQPLRLSRALPAQPCWWAGKFNPYDPEANARCALQIWRREGWRPWTSVPELW